MSTISPMRLRRAASTTCADLGTVDPSSVFGYDSWASSNAQQEPKLSPPYEQKYTAGSDVSFNSSYVGKRLHVDTLHNEPETPLRKVRGQSISAIGYSGLVTPQSVNRSFSTSSLPLQTTPGHSLPSPLDTPLATPMSTASLDNPFDCFYESKASNNWQFDFDLPSVPPTSYSQSSLMRNNMTRSPSATSMCSRSDDDALYTPVSSSTSIYSMAAGKEGSSGVNPFYCPPPCLRKLPTQDIPVNGMSSANDLGHTSVSPRNEVNDAGVSLTDMDDRDVPVSGHHDETDPTFFGGSLDDHDHDLGLFNFPQVADFSDVAGHTPPHVNHSINNSPPQGLMVPASRKFSLRSNDDESASPMSLGGSERSRSSSVVSCPSSDMEKQFLCTSCSKRFRRMEHLRRHQKTHTLERPFACTVANCGRRFSRTDNLKAHILTHTKKSGRNLYVEGLAETQDIKPIKRRKPKKSETEIAV